MRRALGWLRAWKAMADLAEFVGVIRVSGAAVGAQAVHVVLDVVPAPHADLWAVVVCCVRPEYESERKRRALKDRRLVRYW